MYVNDAHVYLSRPHIYPALRPLILIPGQYIQLDISAWRANDTSNLTCSKLNSSCPAVPNHCCLCSLSYLSFGNCSLPVAENGALNLSFPHNPLCIHSAISMAVPQKCVCNLCLPLLLPPLSPSLSSFRGYFSSFSLPLCSLFTAQQPHLTTHLLKTLPFKFPNSEALYSFLGLFLLLLLFSSFSLLELHWPLHFP